jgi:hypothetical protein
MLFHALAMASCASVLDVVHQELIERWFATQLRVLEGEEVSVFRGVSFSKLSCIIVLKRSMVKSGHASSWARASV